MTDVTTTSVACLNNDHVIPADEKTEAVTLVAESDPDYVRHLNAAFTTIPVLRKDML